LLKHLFSSCSDAKSINFYCIFNSGFVFQGACLAVAVAFNWMLCLFTLGLVPLIALGSVFRLKFLSGEKATDNQAYSKAGFTAKFFL